MKQLDFRQPRRVLMLVLVVIYLAVVLTVVFINFDALAEIVNGTAAGAGAKGTGLLAGAVVFVPLILLLVLATQKAHLRGDAETLTVRIGRKETHLRRRDVAEYTMNEPGVGRIVLRSADGEVLAQLTPRPQDISTVRELIDQGAYVEIDRHAALRGRVNVVTFARKDRVAGSPRG